LQRLTPDGGRSLDNPTNRMSDGCGSVNELKTDKSFLLVFFKKEVLPLFIRHGRALPN
jgi:hypothetical protein